MYGVRETNNDDMTFGNMTKYTKEFMFCWNCAHEITRYLVMKQGTPKEKRAKDFVSMTTSIFKSITDDGQCNDTTSSGTAHLAKLYHIRGRIERWLLDSGSSFNLVAKETIDNAKARIIKSRVATTIDTVMGTRP